MFSHETQDLAWQHTATAVAVLHHPLPSLSHMQRQDGIQIAGIRCFPHAVNCLTIHVPWEFRADVITRRTELRVDGLEGVQAACLHPAGLSVVGSPRGRPHHTQVLTFDVTPSLQGTCKPAFVSIPREAAARLLKIFSLWGGSMMATVSADGAVELIAPFSALAVTLGNSPYDVTSAIADEKTLVVSGADAVSKASLPSLEQFLAYIITESIPRAYMRVPREAFVSARVRALQALQVSLCLSGANERLRFCAAMLLWRRIAIHYCKATLPPESMHAFVAQCAAKDSTCNAIFLPNQEFPSVLKLLATKVDHNTNSAFVEGEYCGLGTAKVEQDFKLNALITHLGTLEGAAVLPLCMELVAMLLNCLAPLPLKELQARLVVSFGVAPVLKLLASRG